MKFVKQYFERRYQRRLDAEREKLRNEEKLRSYDLERKTLEYLNAAESYLLNGPNKTTYYNTVDGVDVLTREGIEELEKLVWTFSQSTLEGIPFNMIKELANGRAFCGALIAEKMIGAKDLLKNTKETKMAKQVK